MLTHSQLKRLISALSLTMATVACSNCADAHQFEDGFVERTVAVRIRDRMGTLEYSFGLNDATMEKFRNNWPNDQALYEEFQQAKESLPVAQPHEKNSPNHERNSIEGEDTDLPEDGTLVNEIDLIRAFAKTATPRLSEGLRIFANEHALTLKLVSATPSARHHATLETIWQFQLPAVPIIRLSVRDTNFLQQPGGIKYSLKTSGTSMTVQSNVAPILIRSTRKSFDTTSVSQRLLAPGIESRIRILQPSNAEK